MRILVLANNLLGLYSFRKEVMKAFVDRGDEGLISAPLDDKAPDVEKLGCKIIATEFNRQGTNPIADLKLMWRSSSPCLTQNARRWVTLQERKPSASLTARL